MSAASVTFDVDGTSYTLPHATGEPCGLVELARKHFGDDAENVLMEFTCFPFDDVQAYSQLLEGVAAHEGEAVSSNIGTAA